MGVKRFEDLRVWQEAKALSDDIAPVLRRAALADDPTLRSQLGAPVASIMSNIAKSYQDLEQSARSVPFARSFTFDLDQYVTEKALDGLFPWWPRRKKRSARTP